MSLRAFSIVAFDCGNARSESLLCAATADALHQASEHRQHPMPENAHDLRCRCSSWLLQLIAHHPSVLTIVRFHSVPVRGRNQNQHFRPGS